MALMPKPVSRLLQRIAHPFLLALAIVVVLVDDAFRAFVIPAVRALARLSPIRRIEAAIAGLPPYGILTLFVVPLAVIEPFKLYALYLFSLGHFLAGILAFCAAKVIGLGLAERLFAIGRDKLLTIGWFAWCFWRCLGIRDAVHARLQRNWAWKEAKRFLQGVRSGLSAMRTRLGAWLPQGGRGWLAAARRRARQRFVP